MKIQIFRFIRQDADHQMMLFICQEQDAGSADRQKQQISAQRDRIGIALRQTAGRIESEQRDQQHRDRDQIAAHAHHMHIPVKPAFLQKPDRHPASHNGAFRPQTVQHCFLRDADAQGIQPAAEQRKINRIHKIGTQPVMRKDCNADLPV